MKQIIEQVLNHLIGLSFWAGGRAGTMEWLEFGARFEIADADGTLRHVGDYALHIQCPWRLIGLEGVVTGSTDYFHEPQEPYREMPGDTWDLPGANRHDRRMAEFFEQHAANDVVVEAVCADAVGSIRLSLSYGYAIEVFPDDSLAGEHWRLFHPHNDDTHFVVRGVGVTY